MASTWDGWQADLLRAAGVLVTPPNIDFLTGWHQHAHHGDCTNNPIDLSKTEPGSSNCAFNTGVGAWSGHNQNYDSHADAKAAFNTQLRTDWVKPLRDALNTGNPFQITAAQEDKVVSVLFSWGSSEWALAYDRQFKGQSSTDSPGGKADLLGGWHSLRRSLNRNWRPALNRGNRSLDAALRAVSHSRKVRH